MHPRTKFLLGGAVVLGAAGVLMAGAIKDTGIYFLMPAELEAKVAEDPSMVGTGVKVGAKTVKVHLDGYNITDALAGKSPSPRHEFFYFNDDGSLVGLRYNQWKIVFAEQREHGLNVWEEPFVALRLPKLFNLRSDPFETADHEGMDYERWRVEHLFVMVPAQ